MIPEDAQAILLLASYLGPLRKDDFQPLTLTEWNRFSVWLKEKKLRPGDLLHSSGQRNLQSWYDPKIPVQRIEALLDRGAMLAVGLEKWQRTGIWVLIRSDEDYPSRLRNRLGHKAPVFLFGAGNKRLLESGGIAVVGSRNITATDAAFADAFCKRIAMAGMTIVSGGARGVDETSMLGALAAEGTVIGVLADSLFRTALAAKYREGFQQKGLVLISPNYPEAGFSAGNAMARNKYVYCLSDAAVIIHSGLAGGTWNGALENLKHRWVPTWIRVTEDPNAGNTELIHAGGTPLPEHALSMDLSSLFARDEMQPVFNQDGTDEPLRSIVKDPATATIMDSSGDDRSDSSESDFDTFILRMRDILHDGPKSKKQIEATLAVPPSQLKTWLARACNEGIVTKRRKPVLYELRTDSSLDQMTMFD